MKIGLLVAMAEEITPFLEKSGEPLDVIEVKGYKTLVYRVGDNILYVIGSGVGENAASATVQYLITAFGVEMIVNFGVVGGLTDRMKLQAVCVVEKAVHYDFDASPFLEVSKGRYIQFPDIFIPASEELIEKALKIKQDIIPVVCASADKFVADPEEKRRLYREFGADICDMETAGILLTCHRNEVPAILIKAVSDSVEGGAEEFSAMVEKAAAVCVDIVMGLIS